jgi:signal transduction histidine kinase
MRWQDIALTISRLLVLGACIAVMMTGGLVQDTQTLMMGGGIAGVLLLLSAGLASVQATKGIAPFLFMLSDWVLAGAVIFLSQANPMLTVAVIGFLAFTYSLSASALFTGIHAVVLFLVGAGLAVTQSPAGQAYIPTLIIVGVMLLGAGIWTYFSATYGITQEKRFEALAEEQQAELAHVRDRARAMSEVTSAVTATLDYQQILEAVLDVGNLVDANNDQLVFSMVLLFRDDNKLSITSTRGFKQDIEGKLLPSNKGIIGKTLSDATSVLGTSTAKDPILGQLPNFKQAESVLSVPLRANYDNFGLLVYGSAKPDVFSEDVVAMFQAIGQQATVALQNAVLQENLREEKTRIMQMGDDARKSLVRDLHDVPTQTISGVAMRLEVAMKMLSRDPNQALGELKEIRVMAMRAVTEIRHVLFKLRPLALESRGLIAAVDQLAEKMGQNYNQNVTVKMAQDIENFLDEQRQGALFYLIEEAVNNARKYAEAPVIMVKGARKDQTLIVNIADNGKGFDMGSVVNADYNKRGSFGMVNMQERADLLDATLDVKSVVGKGTSITLTIPIIAGGKVSKEVSNSKLANETRRSLT